ncbi:hypothetical protein COLO4_32852 [Corchorus olitorius]|uniref:Uncharacterized protein n=1 Tax=Corchorus olitorius TaxID=93759 RepID=A0A1R3GXL3_9ROSI|nr:hypothetical protein COLO4_32852 [Corchorus olitorius]
MGSKAIGNNISSARNSRLEGSKIRQGNLLAAPAGSSVGRTDSFQAGDDRPSQHHVDKGEEVSSKIREAGTEVQGRLDARLANGGSGRGMVVKRDSWLPGQPNLGVHPVGGLEAIGLLGNKTKAAEVVGYDPMIPGIGLGTKSGGKKKKWEKLARAKPKYSSDALGQEPLVQAGKKRSVNGVSAMEADETSAAKRVS